MNINEICSRLHRSSLTVFCVVQIQLQQLRIIYGVVLESVAVTLCLAVQRVLATTRRRVEHTRRWLC